MDGEAHLADERAHKKLERGKTPEIANRVRQFIHQVGYMDDIELYFLIPLLQLLILHIYWFLYAIFIIEPLPA